jgi:SAM-dependent methyltransferase
MRSGLISKAKNMLIRGGRRTYVVPFGLYRGIKFELDLQSNIQLLIGLWELETHHYIKKWSDYEWIIDVGAGTGELCLFMLRDKPKVKRIFAIEPSANEVERMKLNFQLNPDLDVTKIIVVEKRIAARTSAEELRLDDVGLQLMSAPGFIKIDVDGYEIEALNGGKKLLQGRNVDVLIETHTAALETECIGLLRNLGFTTEVIKNGWYRQFLPEHRPSDHNRWLWATKR